MDSLTEAAGQAKREWTEFFIATTIHGAKYIAEPHRTTTERIWWSGILFVSILISSFYAYQVLQKTPISITDANDTFTGPFTGDLVEIPFPAITICDNMKYRGSSEKTVEPLLFVCGDPHPLSYDVNVTRLIQESPSFNRVCLLRSSLNSIDSSYQSNCTTMSIKIITDQGVCHSFNIYDPSEIFKDNVVTNWESHGRQSEWTINDGYSATAADMEPLVCDEPLKHGTYPKRATYEAVFTFFHEETTGHYCGKSGPGYKVYIHSPMEVPSIGLSRNLLTPLSKDEHADGFIDLPINSQVDIIIEPNMTFSGIMWPFDANKRKCYYENEKELAYFKYYTENNCLLECYTNLTIRNCKCSDFYMPRFNNNEIRICKRSNLSCILSTMDTMKKEGKELCRCYPPCSSLHYRISPWMNYISGKEDMSWNDSSLKVYIEKKNYTRNIRRAYYTDVNVIDCHLTYISLHILPTSSNFFLYICLMILVCVNQP